jgi:hypothetical protein
MSSTIVLHPYRYASLMGVRRAASKRVHRRMAFGTVITLTATLAARHAHLPTRVVASLFAGGGLLTAAVHELGSTPKKVGEANREYTIMLRRVQQWAAFSYGLVILDDQAMVLLEGLIAPTPVLARVITAGVEHQVRLQPAHSGTFREFILATPDGIPLKGVEELSA